MPEAQNQGIELHAAEHHNAIAMAATEALGSQHASIAACLNASE